eukprot:TRINITY_DN51596_c0_g1_i1.p1 TRINITY_DN51596_c0_g1~~TRINITY_DN51596_c0_g1_i1.p1  ORF type:complete len:247 (-),score=76.37 TRINITY_DN51596_c0_g1_i1:189-929(-)
MTSKAVQSSEDLDAMLQMFEAELKQVAPAKQPPQQQHQQQRRISSSSSSKRPVRSGVRASAVLAAPAVPSTLAQQQQELSAASAASSAVTTIARPPITTLQELDYLTSKVVAQEQRAKSLNAGLYMESGGQQSVVSLTTSNAAFFARPVTQQSSSNTLNSADGSGAGGGGGASSSSSGSGKSKSKYGKKTHKKSMRTGAGSVWEDQTMEQWPDNDYRLFCGDLGNELMLSETRNQARRKVLDLLVS